MLGTIVYLVLLATDTVNQLRGNEQWHIPYVSHPANEWWWLPLIPGAAICLLAVARWPVWVVISAGMAATAIFVYTLFAAEWGGGDNLLAKIINGANGFQTAAAQITNLPATLRNYSAFLATFEPSSHVPSHPPGDVLLFKWLDDLMQANPGFANATLALGRPFISGIDMLLGAATSPT